MSKTTAAPHPRLDLTTIGHHLAAGDLESLIGFYADGAELEFRGPEASLRVSGPIGLREGLERIMAGGLRHELRLAAISYSGSYVIDRCRDPRTQKPVAWGGLTIRGGLITHHSHSTPEPRLGGAMIRS